MSEPRPWLECVELNQDVLSELFSEDIFALDFGPLADYLLGKDLGVPIDELPRVPTIYRDPDSFFNSSYLTTGMRSLLRDVLGRLCGEPGNRVLKLVTPFGGGKSHMLAALLHATRSRSSLDMLPEASGLPRPDGVRIAAVDGQFFDARVGKNMPNSENMVKTLWGWLAWSLGREDGYEIVRRQDEDRVAPGADQIVELLRQGPSMILLDELLEYLISAGGVQVLKTTLRDETLSFMKRLTVAVGNVDDAVLVYSLQSSKREALEYTSLLQTVEQLAARKDQRREPVEGDEILKVIQRRLLAAMPNQEAASATAEACRQVYSQMRRAYAHSDVDRQQADEEGLEFCNRVRQSYPFHPALIDLMRERWAAIPDFQRTRGALRFLASCLRAAHRSGRSRLLLGPGDVQLGDGEVRLAFFKEVGQREDLQSCLEHDFVGANARTKRIDGRRAREVTSEAGKESAQRIATAILLYSFGGLKRAGGSEADLLPPGISEAELFKVCVSPDLDSTTTNACLKELREQCLYLHFDGVRYCFKKDPNVTLLIEQETEAVARDASMVLTKTRELIEERLSGERGAVIWPSASSDIQDMEPTFLVAYLPLEFVSKPGSMQKEEALSLLENYGNRARGFRNGLGLAIPSEEQVDALRRSVTYLLAIGRVRDNWRELNLTDAQKDQLKEREATEKAAAESSLLRLYPEVWLPRSDNGALSIESVTIGGRPLQTSLDGSRRAMIHQRIMELLVTVQRKVFGSLAPGRITELYKLGIDDSPELGVETRKVVEGFFSFLGYPRLISADVVRAAIARGVETGLFAYTTGKPNLGENGRYLIDWNRVAFDRLVLEDEIDLDSGFLIVPQALPEQVEADAHSTIETGTQVSAPTGVDEGCEESVDLGYGQPTLVIEGTQNRVELAFNADRNTLFSAWNALANLADLAGEVSITARASAEQGFEPSRLENGVIEPLRELGLLVEQEDD